MTSFELLETRVLPTVTFQASVDDPGGAYASYYNDLIQNCEAAGAAWGQYLLGNSSIEVLISFANVPTANAASATTYFLRNENGIDVYAQGAAGEILTGTDNNGATEDIHITFGFSYLVNELWFDPTPYDDVEAVPLSKTDTFSIFVHELGHGLGFNGWANGTDASVTTYESTWDRNLSFDGTNLYFNGPNAQQVYGGPVPVTYGSGTHIGNAAPRPGSELDHDVMNGITAYRGERRRPSALDVAILADAEVPLTGNQAPVGLLLSNIVASLPESTSTTSRVKVADIDIVDDEAGTNVLTVTGADAAAFEIFGGDLYLKSGTALNFESKTTYQVTVNLNDSGVGITPDVSKNLTLTITDVNEAPTAVNFSNTVTTLLDTTSTASRVKLADITVTDDALGSNVLSVSGPDAAFFELLGPVLYLKAGTVLSVQKPTYQVTVNVNDVSVGGTPDASKLFVLAISSLNTPPSAITLNNAVTTLVENTSTTPHLKLGDIVVTDDGLGTNVLSLSGPDMSAFEIVSNALYLKAGIALNYEAKTSYQVTISVDDSTLGSTPDASTSFTLTVTDADDPPSAVNLSNTVNSLAENTVTTSHVKLADVAYVDVDGGTDSLSISGVDAAVFELIGTELYLKAGTVLNFEVKSSYQVSVNADDGVGSGPDASRLFTLSITDINEIPTGITLTNTVTVLPENSNTSSRVKLANVAATDDAIGNNVYSLTGADASAFELISGVLYLKAGIALNFESKASCQVTINVDDASLGTSPDASTNFTLTVTDVNEPPNSLLLSSASVAENLPAGTVIGTFSSTDPDAGDTTFSFAMLPGSGNPDNSSFTIVNGELRTTASFNFEVQSSYSIIVRSTDQGGQKLDKSFAITVSNVNEAPTDITVTSALIAENQLPGSIIGLILTIDPDVNDAFTSILVPGGPDNNSFSIVNNQLFTTESFDFETQSSYSIRVRSTDPGGLTVEKQIVISVDDLNEAPTAINLSATSIAENQSSGSLVGTLSATDADAGNTFTYELVDGTGSTDNGSFTIQSGQLRTGTSFDFEIKNTYAIRVRVTDQDGLTFDKQFTIAVTNVNDTPTNVGLNTTSIAENHPGGSVVGTFNTTDQDVGNTFTYSLVTGAGSTDNASFTTSSGQLLTVGSLNFETKNSYSIRVRSTDQGGLTVERQLSITVSNVNETPTGINLPVAPITENLPGGTVLGTFTSNDPDAGNTFTYTFASGAGSTDNSSFTISNGQLLTVTGFDFETHSSATIRVRTTDQGGQSFETTFTFPVTDVNEAPVIATNQEFTVAENSAASAIVDAMVVATDPDKTSPFNSRTFSITGGNTDNAFSINASTGQIAVNNPTILNFETNPLFTLEISLTDGGGASAIPTAVKIYLADVNESPTITAIGPQLLAEDGITGTLSFTVGDPETLASGLTVQATSSNPALIPDANLALSGPDATRGLVIQPLANQSGTATITVTVSDGTNSNSRSFVMTVLPINDAPTLSGFDPQTILEDQSAGPLDFTMGDSDNPINGLTLTVTSSNTPLIPNSGIVINGTGSNRTLVLTPAANQSGTTVITVTLSDGLLTTIEQFDLTINPVDDLPVLTVNSQPLAYQTSSKQIVAIDSTATIADVDTPNLNFTGSILKVSGQAAKDQLLLLNQGGIARKGKNVQFNGTTIGTLLGGKKGAPLTVNFNASASQAAVQATLRAIGFKSIDKVAGNRSLQIQITNIGGKNVGPATRQIQVSP